MLINPIRNGRRIRPTFGHKRGGCTLRLCLICSRAWWRDWSMAAIQDATLVVNALEMALARRRPQAGLLHHSDRGSTYTSESYLALLQQNAMTVSMSRTANCYDNAVTEAFFIASKVNVLIMSPFSPVLRLAIAPLSLLKPFIHRTRRHSTLQYMSPVMYEQLMC